MCTLFEYILENNLENDLITKCKLPFFLTVYNLFGVDGKIFAA